MYIHHVIDFLEKEYSNHPLKNKFVNEMVGSIHFDINSITNTCLFDLMTLPDIDFYENLFFGEHYGTNLKMPYPECCFAFPNEIFYAKEVNNENDLFVRIWTKGGYSESKTPCLMGDHYLIKDVYDSSKRSDVEAIFLGHPFSDDGCETHSVDWHRAECCSLNFILMLLNCKNITTIEKQPPEKLNKKRAKKGKYPLFTYKKLVIKPTGKKQAAQEAQGLWENRVHLCRGHFKNYTEENPLFGKFTGRYWWPPSVRGNKKKGVVMKDYLVKT